MAFMAAQTNMNNNVANRKPSAPVAPSPVPEIAQFMLCQGKENNRKCEPISELNLTNLNTSTQTAKETYGFKSTDTSNVSVELEKMKVFVIERINEYLQTTTHKVENYNWKLIDPNDLDNTNLIKKDCLIYMSRNKTEISEPVVPATTTQPVVPAAASQPVVPAAASEKKSLAGKIVAFGKKLTSPFSNKPSSTPQTGGKKKKNTKRRSKSSRKGSRSTKKASRLTKKGSRLTKKGSRLTKKGSKSTRK
jgi:hypothetical protein